MILLVPISPEVPSSHRPKLWPGLLLIWMLMIVFIATRGIVESDINYLEDIQSLVEEQEITGRPESEVWNLYLKKRPLLKIAPSQADWSIPRFIFANFLHGSLPHLFLNLVGAFAGARICTVFIGFYFTLALFVIGGSLGLATSTLFTSQVSSYIPHLGSSAGVFAMMGTYYIYNFHFRTRYFFWFPTRHGLFSLRTSWFFFIDVILLEIILTAGHFFPGKAGSVDHLAHVAGFASGVSIAYAIRFLQCWPSFLQTKAEFRYWKTQRAETFFAQWIDLLKINRFNDQVKVSLCDWLRANHAQLSDAELEETFSYFTPTFTRLKTREMAALIDCLLSQSRGLPQKWLRRMPYDCIIVMARYLLSPTEKQNILFAFLKSYYEVHALADTGKKVEPLISRLQLLLTLPASAPAETNSSASEDSTLSTNTEDSVPKKATRAS